MRTIITNMRLKHFHITRKRKRIINFRDIRSYFGRFRVSLHLCVRGMEINIIVSTLRISGFRHDPVMHFFTFLNANIRWNPGLLAFKVPSHRVGNKKVKLSEGFIWHFSGYSRFVSSTLRDSLAVGNEQTPRQCPAAVFEFRRKLTNKGCFTQIPVVERFSMDLPTATF